MSKLPPATPSQRAMQLLAVLGAICELSDRVKAAQSPLDRQGCLLALDASIQRGLPRLRALARTVAAECGEPAEDTP